MVETSSLRKLKVMPRNINENWPFMSFISGKTIKNSSNFSLCQFRDHAKSWTILKQHHKDLQLQQLLEQQH
jgi:hypothetical protein